MMPIEFCCACDNRHDPADLDSHKCIGASDSRTTRSSAKMAKTSTQETEKTGGECEQFDSGGTGKTDVAGD